MASTSVFCRDRTWAINGDITVFDHSSFLLLLIITPSCTACAGCNLAATGRIMPAAIVKIQTSNSAPASRTGRMELDRPSKALLIDHIDQFERYAAPSLTQPAASSPTSPASVRTMRAEK